MHGIEYLVPLIDRYATFTRIQETWEEDSVPGYLVHHGMVTKVKEVWDDSQGVPLYQGVEVLFHDASSVLVKPSEAWRLEVWGESHQEAVEMLAEPLPDDDYLEADYGEDLLDPDVLAQGRHTLGFGASEIGDASQ